MEITNYVKGIVVHIRPSICKAYFIVCKEDITKDEFSAYKCFNDFSSALKYAETILPIED